MIFVQLSNTHSSHQWWWLRVGLMQGINNYNGCMTSLACLTYSDAQHKDRESVASQISCHSEPSTHPLFSSGRESRRNGYWRVEAQDLTKVLVLDMRGWLVRPSSVHGLLWRSTCFYVILMMPSTALMPSWLAVCLNFLEVSWIQLLMVTLDSKCYLVFHDW